MLKYPSRGSSFTIKSPFVKSCFVVNLPSWNDGTGETGSDVSDWSRPDNSRLFSPWETLLINSYFEFSTNDFATFLSNSWIFWSANVYTVVNFCFLEGWGGRGDKFSKQASFRPCATCNIFLLLVSFSRLDKKMFYPFLDLF